MTEIVWLVLGGSFGSVIGAFAAWRATLRYVRPKIENIDYKDRWETAVEVLMYEGRLTEDELQRITAPTAPVLRAPEGSMLLTEAIEVDQSTLYKMFSSDRRAIEIARAQAGLPQQDDLKGMYSSDIRAVMLARAKGAQ